MEIPIRNKYLYMLSFADDQVVIAHDEDKKDLRYMIGKLKNVEHSKDRLDVNFTKTECLAAGIKETRNLEISENSKI